MQVGQTENARTVRVFGKQRLDKKVHPTCLAVTRKSCGLIQKPSARSTITPNER